MLFFLGLVCGIALAVLTDWLLDFSITLEKEP